MKKESLVHSVRELAEAAPAGADTPQTVRGLLPETALLSRTFDGAPEPVCIWDAKGRLLLANPAYANLLDSAPRDLVGKTVDDLFQTVQAVAIKESNQRVLASGQSENVVEVVTTSSGQRYLHTAKSIYRAPDGQILGVLALAGDITEFKKLEQQLALANERYEMAARAVSGFVYDWDPEQDRIERAGNFTPLLGYQLNEVEQTAAWWMEQIHPDDQARVAESYAPQVTGGDLYETEYRVRHRDGYYVQVWDRALLLRNEQGQVTCAVGNITDITGRRDVELANARLLIDEQKMRRAAESANRAKDEFLAVVSHELRAPLSAMLGWAKILTSGKYTPESFNHAIEIIERSARTQQKIIEDLLDSARIIRGDLRLEVRPVNLAQIVGSVIQTLRPAIEAKGIELELDLSSVVDPITGDPDRLQQVVWNLISNAVKFSPRGGQLTIRMERVDPHIQLTVSDTGKGISAEMLPYIFERFRQADSSTTRRHGGLGLGLSLVKNLVELHGGTVMAASAGEDRGATFTINLPVRAIRVPTGGVEEGTKTARRKTARQLEGLRVLVIDDELDAREMVATMLEQNGAQVTIADSVATAFAAFNRPEQVGALPFDVVVSDLGMPREDGYSFVRRLRNLPPEQGGLIPAIALTAYGRAEDRIRVLSAGFQTHVLKPVEPAELVIVIANLTGRGKMSGRK